MDYSKFSESLDYVVNQLKAGAKIQLEARKQITAKQTCEDNQHYWNSRQDRELFKETLDRVYDCLRTADKYGGRVFGGFVRNILIPTIFEQTINGYKDVDIWFQSQENADLFVVAMGDKLAKGTDSTEKISEEVVYPFARQQYFLKGKYIVGNNEPEKEDDIIIDVIVSMELPVNDFDVNQLTYSSTERYKSFGSRSVEKLMSCIVNKKATMLPGYSLGKKHSMHYNIQSKRIYKLIQCGWTILNQTGEKLSHV
ncbi:Hypothetical protein HVR_LOCUS937 [uncultured virus]|nr:Hypothetical protein HVR_LOCUS937 [uncultured virus]